MVGSVRLGVLVMATGWDFSVGQVGRWRGLSTGVGVGQELFFVLFFTNFFSLLFLFGQGTMRKVVNWCEEAPAADSQGSGRWKCSGIRGFFTTNTKHTCPQPEPEASPNPPSGKWRGPAAAERLRETWSGWKCKKKKEMQSNRKDTYK